VAEYRTRLPEKKLLQAKLHEFYQLARQEVAATNSDKPTPALLATKPRRRKNS
jgi:hypothetical protein